MSDTATTAPATAPPAAALSAVHTAIRRGSVLKAAPPPAAAATAAAERARLDYLREATEEAEALSNNAALLHTLHRQASAEGIPPPPPPPPAESESDDSVPPPPPAPAAALLEDIANPLLRVSLAPVNPGALRLNDGLNPAQATLLAITSSARGPPQSKLRPVAVGPNGGLSSNLIDSYLAEEAELAASLAANRGLVDELLTSGPPPAFPESDADLAEAHEAKRQEEEALVKMPAPAEDNVVAASSASASSGAAADKVVRARRNSKLLLHAELTKPLARLALNPVITEEKDIKTIVKEQQEAEAAAAAAAAAEAPAAAHDEDAQAEYAVKPRRKKGAGDEEEEAKRSEAEDEEEDADDEEAAPASRKKKGGASKRKGKAASAAASAEDASVPGASAPSKKRSAKESAEDAAADASELTNVIYQQLAHSSTTPTVLAQEVIKQYRDPKKSNAAQIALINFMLHVKALQHDKATVDSHSDTVNGHVERLFTGVFVHRFRDTDPDLRALCIDKLGEWLLALPSMWLTDSKLKYLGWTLNDKASNVRLASLNNILRLLQSPVSYKADTFMERFSQRIEEMSTDIDPSVSAVAVLILSARLESGLLKGEEGEEVPKLLWDESADTRGAAVRFILADTFGGDKGDEEAAAPRSEAKAQSDIEQLLNIFEKYCPLVEKDEEKESQAPRSRALVDGAVLVGTSDLQRPMDTMVNGFWDSLSCLQDYSAVCTYVLSVAAPRASSKVAGSKKKAAPVDEDRQLVCLYLLNSVCKRATGTMEAPGVPTKDSSKKSERDLIAEQSSAFSGVLCGVIPQLLQHYLLDNAKLTLLLEMIRRLDLTQFAHLRKKKEFSSMMTLLRDAYLKHSDPSVLDALATTFGFLVHTEHTAQDEAANVAADLASKLADTFSSLYERVHGSQMDLVPDEADEPLVAILHALRRMVPLFRVMSPAQLGWDALPALEKTLQFYAMNHESKQEQDVLIELLNYAATSLFESFRQMQAKVTSEEGGEEEEEAMDENAEQNEEEEEKKSEAEEEEEETAGKKKRGRGSSKKKKSAARGKKGKRASVAASAAASLESQLSITHRLLGTYLSQLDLIFNFPKSSTAVQDRAFLLLADCFVRFSGKLSGTPLERLSIGHDDPSKLQMMQTVFNQHLDIVMAESGAAAGGGSQRAKKQEVDKHAIMDRKFEMFRAASQVVMFDLNSGPAKDELHTVLRHRVLAGAMLLRFGKSVPEASSRHSAEDVELQTESQAEVDALLKAMQSELKRVSVNTLLMAQLEALKHGWNATQETTDLHRLAGRFVAQHNVKPDSRSFVGLLHRGMQFAMQEPPSKIDFFHAIEPFLTRASNDDVKQTARTFERLGTHCLSLVAPEDRAGADDDWAAMQMFADAINKKIGRAVMQLTDTAVLISASAASVPGTPAVGKKKGRKGAGSPSLDERITGDVTPMTSPAPKAAPSSRSAGARLSRADEAAALGTVREETKKKGGKKRGRKAKEEEEEEEEEASPAEEEEQEEEEAAPEEEEEKEAPSKSKARSSRGQAAASPAKAATAPTRGRKRAAEQ